MMETEKSRFEWMYEAYPELRLFHNDEDRRTAMKGMRRDLFGRNWRFWLYAGFVLVVSASVAPSVAKVVFGHGARWGISMWVTAPALLLLLLVAYYWGIGLLWQRAVQRNLRHRLLDAGIAVCLGCGYDLRGSDGPRCPECGQDREILPSN